jgi:Flp pilus assembly pilin Flp
MYSGKSMTQWHLLAIPGPLHIDVWTRVKALCLDSSMPGSRLSWSGPAKLGGNMDAIWMLLKEVWSDDAAQDVAEYAVMLAVILVIVVGTLKIIWGKSNNVFSEVASSIQ